MQLYLITPNSNRIFDSIANVRWERRIYFSHKNYFHLR